jgi:hypothetical protein
MSVQPFPNCVCAGFNPVCYTDPPAIPDYVPVIPDPTPVVPTRTYISQTNYGIGVNAVPSTMNAGFLNPIVFVSPLTCNSYDAYVFGSSAPMASNILTGSTVAGSAFSITTPATSATGQGINTLNNTTGGASASVNIIYQPNLYNPNNSPNWTGTFNIDWSLGQVTILTTTLGSANWSLWSALTLDTVPFGFPSSVVISGVVLTNKKFSFYKGTADTTYYKSQGSVVLTGKLQNSNKATATASISNQILTTTTTVIGMNAGQWVYFSGYCFYISQLISATTYRILGANPSFTLANSFCASFSFINGLDVVYNVYSDTITIQNGAIIGGALTITGGSTASNTNVNPITIGSYISAKTNTYPAQLGDDGTSQSTTNYPTGLTPYTIGYASSDSALLVGGNSTVKNSANTGKFQVSQWTSSGYTSTTTLCGLGGITINWYNLA